MPYRLDMLLCSLRLCGVGPFRELTLPLIDDEGVPRRMTVLHGAGGTGKSSVLAAIASTRPGYATVQRATASFTDGVVEVEGERESWAVAHWALGLDDPDRPHPLVVASPNLRAADDDRDALRRREQAMYDKLAQGGGFAFLSLPSTRWFSRQAIAFSAPLRSIARFDVRAPVGSDDASRADLARDVKQALAYSEIAPALAARGPDRPQRFDLLGAAMRSAVGELLGLVGVEYLGCDPASFEPIFRAESGRIVGFDALPTRTRHLVAFPALAVRTLWAAYPGVDPRAAEGLFAIDEAELHQERSTITALPGALARALPRAQWLLTTSSSALAGSVDPRELLTLRKVPELGTVELHQGALALTH